MTDLNKKIKMGTLIHFIILVAVYVLCYFVTSSDIAGGCSECAADHSISLFFGGALLFIQGIIGIFLFISAKSIGKTRYTGGVVSLTVISIIFNLIQMKIVFSTTLNLYSHEDDSGALFELIEVLYNVGRILYVLLLVLYIALIVMAVISGRQMKKEDAEKEIKTKRNPRKKR